MNKTIFIKFFQLSIISIPVLLLTGPFMPDLAISLTSIIFILFYSKELIQLIKKEKVILFFFMFWIYLVISSLFSDHILYSLKSSALYIRFIIFSAVFYYLISFNSGILELFLNFLKIAIYLMCAASLFEFFFEFNLYLNDKPTLRLTGTYKDEQIVGSFLSKIFPIYISLILYLNKKLNAEFFVISLLTFLIVFLSNERTAIFFTISFFMFFVLIYPKFNLKKKLIGIFTVIFFIFTIIFSVEDVKGRTIDLTLSQMGVFLFKSQDKPEYSNYKKNNERLFVFSRSHEIHALTALNMFKVNFISGVGPKVFRKACDNQKYYISVDSCTTHPHNILFQILAETGIFGLAFFVTSIIYLIRNFYYSIRDKNKINSNYISSKLCLIFILSQNIFFLLPSGNFLNNFLAAQMFLPLGLYIFIDRKISNGKYYNNLNN